ncbi:hypothetical protein ES288_D07G215200v1 [Gossypium darwinii]|uniref:Uncharacterized protein n=1 Tax=Gossypium darwinii TaxID=34276 RepID=A0A5D2C0W8_GOSDA|nr:hypothetical protein ES288_D07G215200v1 [Gossypium darwinii]
MTRCDSLSTFSSLFGNREARILVLGLDNAGKTTILYRLQMCEVVSTIPTIGFNVETVQYNNIKFQVWDLGGQTSIKYLLFKLCFLRETSQYFWLRHGLQMKKMLAP